MNCGRHFGSLLLAGALLLPLATIGCAERHYYRVYDPYHSDYHDRDDHERVYYQQWVVETHRDPHRDFRKLGKDDQKQYWNWRHSHPERDHDRDHDHDKH
jgi:hypothetical protein